VTKVAFGKVEEEAEMHVVGNYIFPLNVTKFSIFGKFVSGIINITGIEVFTVGEDGVVEMDINGKSIAWVHHRNSSL
jgi:hypothetical protein